LPDADVPRPAVVVAVCSAADDPTTYGEHGVAVMGRPYSGSLIEARLESAIAQRNIAWAAWSDAADELWNRVTDGEPAPYGPYNDAQKAYEHAVSDLMREQARWRHNCLSWAYYLDTRVDQEFQISTDPPCEDEQTLERLYQQLFGELLYPDRTNA